MSSNKLTRRRDADPVRVYDDGRVAYWTGGEPGKGKREWERRGSRVNGEARAVELRARLLRGLPGAAPHPDATLAEMMQDALNTLRVEGSPEGTLRQYKSDWNAHVPEKIAKVRVADSAIWHYTGIFSGMVREGCSEQVVKNVARTLGYLIQFGADNGYFTDREPLGTSMQRKGLVKKYRKRAAVGQAEKEKRISLEVCPTVSDVEKYALAFEDEYPGYGARLVYIAFGTGVRICEALALRWDSINMETLDVAVDWQLDRYNAWPALTKPKGGHGRTSRLWACYADVAADLIVDSLGREGEGHGWLFPPSASQKAWADKVGRLATAAARSSDWDWSFHWLRHGYASWSMAPTTDGGYAVNPARVQKWLGHAKLSTTTDTYVHEPAEDTDSDVEATRLPPGRRNIS